MTASSAGFLALIIVLVSTASALAGSTPACASAQAAVSATAPAYARQDASVTVDLDVGEPARVTNASVAFLVGSTVTASTPVTLSGTTTEVTLSAPSAGTTLTVATAWDQDAGTPGACSAIAVLKTPLIPALASAGDPSQPRLSGSFAVVERPDNYRAAASRPRWTFTPTCAYFACGVTLASSQGLQLPLALGTDHLYHGDVTADAAQTATSCTVPHLHLYTIKDAYVLREDVYVRIRRSQHDAATRISGSLIAVYTPTRSARRRGCVLTERAVEQFTGRS